MKIKLLFLLAFLLPLLSFSQDKKTVTSGYITFNSGSMLEFKNLTIENEKAFYYNEVAKTEMSFSLQSIKNIVDGSGITIFEASKIVAKKKDLNDANEKAISSTEVQTEPLVYKSVSRIFQGDEKLNRENLELLLQTNTNVYAKYKKGKNEAALGDILIGGGIGLFVGGGLANLNAAKNNQEGGSPAILIVGLATSIIGIPIKLGGIKKVKQSIEGYNVLPQNKTVFLENTELKFVANNKGLGFQIDF
ncbi:hypothetical protein [Flavobacterium soli]|uniref:hypothetical protein n=1 Tax=Flavobacterium soli TaxID=344881 RepID=UPI000407C8E9|nr:hypothetical protein [Flavobacterium soli]